MLLKLLRKCDMLCLPDEATYFRSILAFTKYLLGMLILYYVFTE
nr:MAG TPA: hypothetical protein [Caudoviricetes sp.]